MDNSSLASVIVPVSPVLASTLSGSAASLAVAALGKSVVGDDQASAADIINAIVTGGEEAKLKVKAAEEQLLRALNDAGTTLMAIAAADAADRRGALVQLDHQAAQDRHDARERQSRTNDRTNSILAFVVTAGFFAMLGMLLFYPKIVGADGLPADMKASLQTMLGVLGTAWVGIITFYFGSSIGSKEKTALLEENIVSKPGPPKTN